MWCVSLHTETSILTHVLYWTAARNNVCIIQEWICDIDGNYQIKKITLKQPRMQLDLTHTDQNKVCTD